MPIKVTAPNSRYTGRVGDDHFVDGVCEAASSSHLAYYRQAGFQIEETGTAPTAQQEPQDDGPQLDVVRPAADALKAEWIDYAQQAHGIDTTSMTRDQIIEAIEAAEDQS